MAQEHVIARIERRSILVDRGHATQCRIWTGGLFSQGYGAICTGSRTDGSRRMERVHRVIWISIHGAIPLGMEPDHLCRQRDCHEITHLELVTHRENILRGVSPAARHAKQTHCREGHPLSGENLRRKGTSRICRTCQRERQRERRSAIRRPEASP